MSQGGELEVDVWSTSDVWGPITRASPTCYTPTGAPQQRCASVHWLYLCDVFIPR